MINVLRAKYAVSSQQNSPQIFMTVQGYMTGDSHGIVDES